MDKKPVISIICAAYNVEKYIVECLESVIAQTWQDWELIVVDDGSIDRTPELCDEFARRDARIKVIHQTNAGQSAARNAALRVAKADLITFIDSDDYVAPTWLETMYTLMLDTDADVAQVGWVRQFDGMAHHKSLFPARTVMDGYQACRELLADKRVHSYLWNKLWRREVINCEFPEGKKFEDIYVHSEWFTNVKRFAASPETLYHYRMRGSSTVNTNIAQYRLDYLEVCQHRADTMRRVFPDRFTEQDYLSYVNMAAARAAKPIARYEFNVNVRQTTIKHISHNLREVPNASPTRLGLKKWWRIWLLRNHPNVYMAMMRGVNRFDLHGKMRESKYFD